MYPRMIAANREMNDVLEQLDAVAPFDVSVFLSGEAARAKSLPLSDSMARAHEHGAPLSP